MIRKLRKKFILAAVAAVFLVLLLLIGAINVLNFRSLVRDADSTLEILSQNGGRFPGQMFRPEDQPTEMIPPPRACRPPRRIRRHRPTGKRFRIRAGKGHSATGAAASASLRISPAISRPVLTARET